MKDLLDICKKINLPKQVVGIISLEASKNLFSIDELYKKLSQQESSKAFREDLEDDQSGFKILTYMLLASVKTRELYKKQGIEESVFYDTFQCFTRFASEHLESFGYYGFDRAWWTHRQLAMKLFRIGELEYEMAELEGDKVISIHIPSDANLNFSYCQDSYKNASVFFNTYYPNHIYKIYICDSWLLSPALEKLLPSNSNILRFREDYTIQQINPDDTEFMLWVYKKMDIPFDKLPEHTTLQKNLKVYLLQGGRVGNALGVLNAKY